MKSRILIVEDSATQAEALRSLLEENGYQVSRAGSAEEALQLLSSEEFDMVMSDIMMPGMSGYAFCSKLKGDLNLKIPVVLLTSLNDPMDIIQGLECGADNYITKPYDPQQLIARVQHVLDNRRLRRDAKTAVGLSVRFLGRDFTITSDREQILDLFISTVEDVVRTNAALQRSQRQLGAANSELERIAREKEREAKVSADRYRALLQNARDGLLILDEEGRIDEANERAFEMLGQPASSVLSRPFVDFVPMESRRPIASALRNLPRDRHAHLGQQRFTDAAGKGAWFELTASHIPLDGHPLTLVVAQDATVRKEAEEALRMRADAEMANRAKSDFLSRMSHELRTPLNAILGFGQLLEMSQLDEGDRESVEQILKGGRHLLNLINEVLDLSRVEAGKLTLSLERVAVDTLVQEVIDLMRPLADQQGTRLLAELGDPTATHVLADPQRLKQIILNYVANALKYGDKRGAVTIHISRSDNQRIRISVSDKGAGLTPDQLSKLFVPFERLNADQTGIQGSGLGLVLAKGLAHAMGGDVGAESQLGEGSVFWVELQSTTGAPEREGGTGAVSSTQPVARGRATRTVLYIEDNPANMRLVERVLDRPGFSLLTAVDGTSGLAMAREHRPDVVLLDLDLPDISGEEVLEQMRRDPALKDTPVIVISAEAMPGHADRLVAAGASSYFTKPLHIPMFLDALNQVLTRKR